MCAERPRSFCRGGAGYAETKAHRSRERRREVDFTRVAGMTTEPRFHRFRPRRGVLAAAGRRTLLRSWGSFLASASVSHIPVRAVADAVSDEIDVVSLEVTVELSEAGGDEGHEHLPVLVGRQAREVVRLDGRFRSPELVRALQRSAYPSLANDGEHSGVDELRDVPVEARRWYVG
jgi:hypothetical protein